MILITTKPANQAFYLKIESKKKYYYHFTFLIALANNSFRFLELTRTRQSNKWYTVNLNTAVLNVGISKLAVFNNLKGLKKYLKEKSKPDSLEFQIKEYTIHKSLSQDQAFHMYGDMDSQIYFRPT